MLVRLPSTRLSFRFRSGRLFSRSRGTRLAMALLAVVGLAVAAADLRGQGTADVKLRRRSPKGSAFSSPATASICSCRRSCRTWPFRRAFPGRSSSASRASADRR